MSRTPRQQTMFTQDRDVVNRLDELERKVRELSPSVVRVNASGSYAVPSGTTVRYVWGTPIRLDTERFARATVSTANDCIQVLESGLYAFVANVLQGGIAAGARGDATLVLNGTDRDLSLGDATTDGYVKHNLSVFELFEAGDKISVLLSEGSAFTSGNWTQFMGVYLGP